MRRHGSILIVLLPLAVGCKKREAKYDVVDTPPPAPVEVERPEAAPEHPDKADAKEAVANCRPGTGKNEAGTCELLRTRKVDGVQQVQIPAGRFVMGDIPTRYDASETRESPRALWSGQPPRHAELPAYWIDLHEVTRAAYAQCVEAGKCTAASCPEGAPDPVEGLADDVAGTVPQSCVTHEQAAAYCEQRGARLPTEAEFEYAARGTDARVYPWGNDLMDEYRATPMPVGGMVDSSYFGIKGLGSNVVEWVAEAFEADVGVRPFVDGEFRKRDGPMAKAMADVAGSHVVKGGRSGARQPKREPDPLVGFRCVDGLDAGEAALVVPALAAEIPHVIGTGVQIFGGVAESVDREEAAAFCEQLKVDGNGETFDDWRLPTLEEVQSIAAYFRGPGPFWTADGAATQHDGSGKRPADDAPWVREDPQPGEPLAARCVRGR
jgi:formylglycine-generating enzyme required for sulfatase activity